MPVHGGSLEAEGDSPTVSPGGEVRVMDVTGRRRIWSLLLVVVATACWFDPSRDKVPSTRETVRRVGRRLSRTCSESELTAIASRGPELLARLECPERVALGAGHCRFQVDHPVVVDVAVPIESVPFW